MDHNGDENFEVQNLKDDVQSSGTAGGGENLPSTELIQIQSRSVDSTEEKMSIFTRTSPRFRKSVKSVQEKKSSVSQSRFSRTTVSQSSKKIFKVKQVKKLLGVDDNPVKKPRVDKKHNKFQAVIPDYNPALYNPNPIIFKPLLVHPIIRSSIGYLEHSKPFDILIQTPMKIRIPPKTKCHIPESSKGLVSLFLRPFPKNAPRPRTLRNTNWGEMDLPRQNSADPKIFRSHASNNDLYDKWCTSSVTMTETEYNDLYQSIGKGKPLHVANIVESDGEVDYKAVLVVPEGLSVDFTESNIKICIKGALTSVNVDDMVPKYLSFVKGIIDVKTLPVTTTRQAKLVKILKKQLTVKVLGLFLQIADEDTDEFSPKLKIGDLSKKGQYVNFWTSFGMSLKLGMIEDAANRQLLSQLLRFRSSKSAGKWVSLDQYIKRMVPGQRDIFYISGTSSMEQRESLSKLNYEVLFFLELIDVDLILYRYLTHYAGYTFCDITKVEDSVADSVSIQTAES